MDVMFQPLEAHPAQWWEQSWTTWRILICKAWDAPVVHFGGDEILIIAYQDGKVGKIVAF